MNRQEQERKRQENIMLKLDELKKLSTPLQSWLQKYYSPNYEIVINFDGFIVNCLEIGVPNNIR